MRFHRNRRKNRRDEDDRENRPLRGRRRRREEEQRLPDLNVRTAKSDKARRNLAAKRALQWGAALGLGLIALAGLKEMWKRMLIENPEYDAQNIRVATDGSMLRGEILREAGLDREVNLLLLDLIDVRKRLEALPQISRADVVRRLPSSLSISVSERRPIAWLRCRSLGIEQYQAQGYVIDEDGVPFSPGAVITEYFALPIVDAPFLKAITPGAPVDDPQVRAAVKLLRGGPAVLADQHLHIDRIRIENAYSVIAVLDDQSQITFSLRDIEGQLATLGRVLAEAEQRGWAIASLNLMMKKNIPVTFFDAPPPGDHAPSRPVPPPTEPTGDQRLRDANAILNRT